MFESLTWTLNTSPNHNELYPNPNNAINLKFVINKNVLNPGLFFFKFDL